MGVLCSNWPRSHVGGKMAPFWIKEGKLEFNDPYIMQLSRFYEPAN
jgi:hypothetical protein